MAGTACSDVAQASSLLHKTGKHGAARYTSNYKRRPRARREIGDRVANHPGQPIGKRYLPMRRPEIYQALLRDIDGDLKASVAEAPELR